MMTPCGLGFLGAEEAFPLAPGKVRAYSRPLRDQASLQCNSD
jgi:hypothetical protein